MSTAAGAASVAPLPPHPRDYPLVGSVPAFIRDTPGTFVDGWREVGDIVRFRGLRTMCLVAHPDHIKQVLFDKSENYPRSRYVNDALSKLLGESTFTADGESWKRRAQLVHPLLKGVPGVAAAVTRAANRTVDGWASAAADRRVLDLYGEMLALSLDAAAGMLFGVDAGFDRAEFSRATIGATEYVVAKLMEIGGPPDIRLRPAYRAYLRAVAHLDSLLAQAIAQRRRVPSDDFLSSLVQAGGGRLTDREVRDEAMTFLHGVYAGVPSALMWTMSALSEHPSVARRVRDELSEGHGAGEPDVGSVRRLPFLGLVVRETLRLYPPFWIFAKIAREDDEIGGFRIPAGMSVVISPYITHRHPEFWPNPEGFDPDRFGDNRDRHPCAFLAFTGGARACPGDQLAQSMIERALVILLSRFRVELVPGRRITQRREFILRPSNGLPVWVKPA